MKELGGSNFDDDTIKNVNKWSRNALPWFRCLQNDRA